MAIGPAVTPPISSFQATRSKVGPLFALAGVATAAWFMKQGYNGNKDLWEQRSADHHTQAEYNYLQEGWGHDSGHPFFDHLEHKLKGMLFFGPNGILTRYHEGHAYSTGFRNDVIYANLFPITLALLSIYLGFGPKVIHGKIAQMFRSIPKGSGNGNVGATVGRAAGSVARTGGKGIKGVAKLFKPAYAPFTLLGLGFLVFAHHTFHRVWTHQAQEDRFRGFIHGAEH